MNEVFEQINHYKWVLIHHRWIALVSGILICMVGWTAVQRIPDEYESETKIYINTESVLRSLLEGITVNSQAFENATQVMQRTLVVRSNLEQVIEGTDLKLTIDESDPVQMEGMLNQLERNIQISSESVSGRDDSRNIYRISYTHHDPQMAKDVVDELLNIFVETILGDSRRDTESAQQFLDEQIALYDQKQREAENKLKLFKQKHAGIMPEDGMGVYSRLNELETRIEETELALREAENRSSSLRSQIDSLAKRKTDPSTSAQLTQDPLDIRIANLEKRLDDLLLQYTDRHPDVINTRRVLEQLRQQKAEKSSEDSDSDSVSEAVFNTDLYQELNVMLSQSEAEISALQTRLDEYRERQQAMNQEILALPEIEAQLASLNRDYEVNKELYERLVMRRESSQLNSKAKETGEELQFRILEQPLVPIRPVSPDRLLLATLVLFAAIGVGTGLAIIYEQIKPTFYTKRQLNDAIDLPVLGVVSMFWTDREISKRRLGIAFFGVITLMLLMSYTGLLAHNSLDMGLDGFINQFLK